MDFDKWWKSTAWMCEQNFKTEDSIERSFAEAAWNFKEKEIDELKKNSDKIAKTSKFRFLPGIFMIYIFVLLIGLEIGIGTASFDKENLKCRSIFTRNLDYLVPTLILGCNIGKMI